MTDLNDNQQPADYRAYRDKAVNDALSKTKFKPRPKTAEEAIIDRAKEVTIAVRQHIKPILQTGGWQDKPAMSALITTLYLEAFNKGFSKDELALICTVVHTEVMLDIIEANPWGGDKPDALSGV